MGLTVIEESPNTTAVLEPQVAFVRGRVLIFFENVADVAVVGSYPHKIGQGRILSGSRFKHPFDAWSGAARVPFAKHSRSLIKIDYRLFNMSRVYNYFAEDYRHFVT